MKKMLLMTLLAVFMIGAAGARAQNSQGNDDAEGNETGLPPPSCCVQ